MGKEKKLKNQRFGRLVVVEKIGIFNHRVLWHCVCDCGNETGIPMSKLLDKAVKMLLESVERA